MAVRYTAEELLHLRESPLCVKPANLPPAEEWMGPPIDPSSRNGQNTRTTATDRPRHTENSLLDPTSRRPGADRHVTRNNANPDDIILGPPRTTFSSATLSRTTKPSDNDKTLKDPDSRDRFLLRPRNAENDASERARDRDGKTTFRRRGDGDQDTEGWSTVKPRNSFGTEGAERFQHRMGERPDRRPREGEERETNPERRRNFGEFSRDKDVTESDKLRRNGVNRNRTDNPWSRDNASGNNNISNHNNNDNPQPKERFDRSKSWRDRPDDHPDTQPEKPKQQFGRWDRDREQRQEREPEWMDEPVEEPARAHTQEEFKKFMELMKAKTATKTETPTLAQDVLKSQEQPDAEVLKPKPVNTQPIELGPDKFFAAFAQKSNLDGNNTDTTSENVAPVSKPKTGSRFQNFFTSQEQARLQPEGPVSPTAPPAPPEVNAFLGLSSPSKTGTQPDAAEKVAFQALLDKLQKQTFQASTPPSGGFSDMPPGHDFGSKNAMASVAPFQQFGQDYREEALPHMLPHGQDMHAPPPQQNTQYAAMRPEQQMLHDLIGQRSLNQGSGGNRAEQPLSRNSNPNTEFLVSLMQGGRTAPESQRSEPLVMRMPQPSRPAHIPPAPDRDPDFQHDRGSLQHQPNVRSAGIAGFFDEQLQQRDVRTQPTHILQRPGQGPPGLDQMPPSNWMQTQGQQLPALGGRPMIPPPGLPGAQRAGPLPGNFAAFPMGGFPHQDVMPAPPPRNMAPPPGFFAGPPPGFMMHPGMGGFQGGPDSPGYGFDARGMPPPGGGAPFRRNN